jgi:hypothetical protein
LEGCPQGGVVTQQEIWNPYRIRKRKTSWPTNMESLQDSEKKNLMAYKYGIPTGFRKEKPHGLQIWNPYGILFCFTQECVNYRYGILTGFMNLC